MKEIVKQKLKDKYNEDSELFFNEMADLLIDVLVRYLPKEKDKKFEEMINKMISQSNKKGT